MELKYALLSDRAGIPIASFDLANGDVITDEVLFSGFITAIQAFMQELEKQENPSEHGLIQAGNMQILFNRGVQTIGVLVGYDIEISAVDQLRFLVKNFEESIGYDFGYWSMNDLVEPFIDAYWRNVLSTFRDQVFHEYYIPFLNDDFQASKERISDEKVELFLSFVDNKKSLREISFFSEIDWNELTLMIAGMINDGVIYLNVSQSSEQRYYLTKEGMNVLLGRSVPPATIVDIWDEVGVVLLNEISPNLTMGEILYRMRHVIEIFGEEVIFGVLKELLHELLVKPYPSIFNLSPLLQRYYLSFYNHIRRRLEPEFVERFLLSIEATGKVHILYPDFENNDIRSPEKMFELIKDYNLNELTNFLNTFLNPINVSFAEIIDEHGYEYAMEIQDAILGILRNDHAELIDKFQLENYLKV